MSCCRCGEDHYPGDICWGDRKPEDYVGFSYDILKIPGFISWFKKKFIREQVDDKGDKNTT